MSERRFSRTPESVLFDPAVTLADLKIYNVLTFHVHEGNIACIGQRRIAQLSGMDRRTIRRCLENLARLGHISTAFAKLKRRSVFQVNSPVFGQFGAVELGVPERPDLGVVARPRIDIEHRGLVSFPKRQPKPQAG